MQPREEPLSPEIRQRIAQWPHSLPEHDDFDAASNCGLHGTEDEKIPFLAAISESPGAAHGQQVSAIKGFHEVAEVDALIIPAP